MENVIHTSIRKTLALSGSLRELQMRDLPSDGARTFVGLLAKLTDAVQTRLIALSALELRSPGTVKDEDVLLLARTAVHIARYAEPIAQGASGSIPRGLALPVETLCRRISPESRVILYPQWEYNYRYREAMDPLMRLMEALANFPPSSPKEDLFRGYPRYFAVISYPAIEQSNTLQHIAWGHEIGHHLNAVFHTADPVMAADIVDTNDVDAVVAELVRPGSTTAGASQSADQLRALVQKTAADLTSKWILELTADMFAIHVFGPASLFAFTDIVPVLHPMDDPGPSHPPARVRTQAMVEELYALGYGSMLEEPSRSDSERQVKEAVLREFSHLKQLGEETSSHPVEPLYIPALNAIHAAIPMIRDRVREIMMARARWACTADLLRHDIFPLIERLNNQIPPCEVDTDVGLRARQTNLAAIVNAGWFYYLWKLQPRLVANEEAAVRQQAELNQLNDMILKAIELSEVKRRLEGKEYADGHGSTDMGSVDAAGDTEVHAAPPAGEDGRHPYDRSRASDRVQFD